MSIKFPVKFKPFPQLIIDDDGQIIAKVIIGPTAKENGEVGKYIVEAMNKYNEEN